MAVNIKFDTDNACFEDFEYSVKEILMDICDKISYGHDEGIIKDVNGNVIGEWSADY